MSVKLPFVMIACAIALHGCTTPQDTPRPLRATADDVCQATVCFVTVSVKNCAAGDIEARPAILGIGRDSKDIHIHWDLDLASFKAGYKFLSGKGIEFKNDANNQFSGHTVSAGGRRFIVMDRNTDGFDYEYKIRIVRDGTECRVKDPIIANGY